MSDPQEFFTAGGTLRAQAPSYVHRPADDELFERVRAGEFCYVLTARQMGKSSLMIRTARRLKAVGVLPVLIDLTGIGTGEPDEWYGGLLERVRRELRLDVDARAWWAEHAALGAPQRFAEFLRDVALAQRPEPIALFIDEIDSTLNLPFRDDFFAAIRAIYNARATEPQYARLTFALLGVATPTDLIQDRERTPFNIGRRIVLQEFSHDDAQPLLAGLQAAHPAHADALLARIFHWTSGHPYLTQKLCAAVAELLLNQHTTPDEIVDGLVATTFFSDEGRKDTNITAVQKGVDDSSPAGRRRMLRLYRDVYAGRYVAADERSRPQNYLELYGLVRPAGGRLHVRNLIYRTIFDAKWARERTPANRSTALAVGASLVAVAIVAAAIYFVQAGTPENRQAQLCEQNFRDATSGQERISALACLFNLKSPQYHEGALRLFYDQPISRQRYFFDEPGALGQEFVSVVENVAATLPNLAPDDAGTDYDQEVLGSMINGLSGLTQPDARVLRTYLQTWKEARALLARREYEQALALYDGLEAPATAPPYQPALQYDRAQALLALARYPDALSRLDGLLNDASEQAAPPQIPASASASPATPAQAPLAAASEEPSSAAPAPDATGSAASPTLEVQAEAQGSSELTQFVSAGRVRETVGALIVSSDGMRRALLAQPDSYGFLLSEVPNVAVQATLVAAQAAAANPTATATSAPATPTPTSAPAIAEASPTAAPASPAPAPPTATPARPTPNVARCVVVSAVGVTVRSAPDFSARDVGSLSGGAAFTPLDRNSTDGRFVWVFVPQPRGWVYAGTSRQPQLVRCTGLNQL